MWYKKIGEQAGNGLKTPLPGKYPTNQSESVGFNRADEVEKGRRVDISVETTENGSGAGALAPIVHLGGEIDLHSCPELRTSLQGLIDNGSTRIILDMAEVPYVDSAALGVLVDTQRRLKEKNGTLYLAAVTPFVLRAFEITRLIRIFHIKDSVADATQAALA